MLSTLFSYYFDQQYLEYKEIDGKIVCALCGIPYSFGYGDKLLKGLYIVPLTSEEGYHKKGILSELLDKFNQKLKEEVDFTFLVPNTELLADYYGSQGYFSSFFILEERYTSMHNFKNDYLLSLTESDERIRNLKKALLEEITIEEYKGESEFTKDKLIDFIETVESKSTSSVHNQHTTKDLDYIFNDNTIRKLTCFFSYDAEKRITGVAFIKKEEFMRIRVVASYVSDSCSYYALLDHIKSQYPDYSLSVNISEPKYQTHSIIQQIYASENPNGGDLDNTFGTVEMAFNINKLLQPLGMVRLLRFEKILEYIAETRSDVDFKVVIRDYKPEEDSKESIEDKGEYNDDSQTVYIVSNGKYFTQEIKQNHKEKSILSLSGKEISELLLRKNDSSNLIMEAFGIPRLNLQIRLLPC